MTEINRKYRTSTFAPLLAAFVAAVCIATNAPSARADAVEDFYRGNTIKLFVSASAGGTYDLAGRVFIKHFSAHIPGRPNVIIVNMPGTVGTANWLYEVADKDGTVLGMPNQSVPMNQVVTPKNIRYDARRFNWIGNLEGATGVIFTYHTSPAKTFRDAQTREPVMGVPTRNSTAYQLLAMSNRLLDTKFKIIAGYERNRVVAMESGELEGTASNIENLAGLAPHWLPKNLINVLAVHGPKRDAASTRRADLAGARRQSGPPADPRLHDAAGGDGAGDRRAARRSGGSGAGLAPRARPDREGPELSRRRRAGAARGRRDLRRGRRKRRSPG